MSRSAQPTADARRGSFLNWFTFIVGIPLGIGALYLIEHGPWQDADLQRYFHHPAEQAVVVLFACCLAALLCKMIGALKERYIQAQTLLPAWDKKPIAAADVAQLQQSLNLVWDSVKNTYIGRRIGNILHFVASRRSAEDLDDQMRTLSDTDAIALDGSYTMLRFMIWAMPILGFLGTVLGITQAIAGINPAEMENGGGGITSGLTKAFDATALALGSTLVAMFFNSLVEKLEQSLLERVDQTVDAELAHRFIRGQAETGSSAGMNVTVQALIEKQVSLWSATMEKAEQRWMQAGPQYLQKIAETLQGSIETSLTRHGQRLAETEKKLLERNQAILDGLTKLVVSLKESGQGNQLALARLTDAIGMSVEMITKVQTSEGELVRLQDSLSQNLALLANSTTFEQAVESLTAAIHLLTTRVNPTQQGGPRVLSMHKDVA